MTIDQLHRDGTALLENLIRIPSFSREEHRTAELIAEYLLLSGMDVHRKANNVWTHNKKYDDNKPTLLLNSHHDTVKPSGQWTLEPFSPLLRDGKLFGLGSNDAGASLVSMLMTMRHFYDKALPFNLVFAATAEEEISGYGGIEFVYADFGKVDYAIVGEPTKMDVAVAEKGLLVLDCIVHGVTGHAARNEGVNAIESALKELHWFSTYDFTKKSEWLGKVKMTVTMISAGTQHNVIPAQCNFTADVRVNELYTLEEILDEIRNNVDCVVTPRSTRLRPSAISASHPLVCTAKSLNKKLYGSPTTSDQALIPAPSIKMGPGDSARSHTSNEFIYLHEIYDGIDGYITFINKLAQVEDTDNAHIPAFTHLMDAK